MTTNNHQTERWEFVLPQDWEKPTDRSPMFTGKALIGTTQYEVAAWMNKITKGKNVGRPCLGLQLTSLGNASQTVSITLWEKVTRKTDPDPHFKIREKLNGRELTFAARIEKDGQLFALRIMIAPSLADDSDLSEEALVDHKRLTDS